MPKYNVFVDEICHYLAKEIEAQDQSEAEEKYMEMIENGDVEVVKSEFQEIGVAKIRE